MFAPTKCNIMSTSSQATTSQHKYDLPYDIKRHLDNEVAPRLPLFPEEYDITNLVSGKDLLAKGVEQIKRNGIIVPVDPDKQYEIPAVALRPIDHKEKLRQFWRAGGLLGVHDYLCMIPDYIKQVKELYPSLFNKSGTFLGVKDGTQMIPKAPKPSIHQPN